MTMPPTKLISAVIEKIVNSIGTPFSSNISGKEDTVEKFYFYDGPLLLLTIRPFIRET
jgi:hypothetical protein